MRAIGFKIQRPTAKIFVIRMLTLYLFAVALSALRWLCKLTICFRAWIQVFWRLVHYVFQRTWPMGELEFRRWNSARQMTGWCNLYFIFLATQQRCNTFYQCVGHELCSHLLSTEFDNNYVFLLVVVVVTMIPSTHNHTDVTHTSVL